MVLLLYILTLLWIVSIFSFARLRILLSGKKTGPFDLHKDRVFQAYLRISGIFILFVIFSIINR